MLREWIDSLRTDCPRPWRRLGYAYAAVACTARARRCAAAWAPHQQRTRDAILAAMVDCVQKRTALILGAGPCLDVPVAELAGAFRRVVLADAAFPPDTARAVAAHPNVSRVLVELTGTADALAAGRPMPPPDCRRFVDDPEIDLVVSVNLLSQLPLLPLAACPHLDGAELTALGRAIVQAHLRHLQAFACPTLLITDVDRRVLDRSGGVLAREDPIYGIALPPGQDWDWDMAPAGELEAGQSIRTTVRAVRLDRSDPW